MTASLTATSGPSGTLSPRQRYLILLVVVLASSLYTTAILTTSTVLPQMQGSLSATQDEIAWAMTFNILATAIVTPMTGWMVARFGTKAVMVVSMGLFTIATCLCGTAGSLEWLVIWRILQGAAGAPLVPLSQTILLDTFPRHRHAFVQSIFGMAVGVAPVLGPVLGGWLAETYSWRWTFHMLVPLGLISLIGLYWALAEDEAEGGVALDWTGFLALSVAMSATQLVLARGSRLDWLDSTEIIVEICVAVLAAYIFLAHCLTAKTPFLTLSILKDRNYAIGLVLVTIYGMLNFTPMVLLPPLLQQHVGFPDSLVGQVLGMRGIGMTVGFLASGLVARLDPRIGMSLGFVLQIGSGLSMMSFDLNVTLGLLLANAAVQGLSVGLLWVPLSLVTFSTLDPRLRPEATSIFHLLRNLGSSFFISITVAEIIYATSANYARMTELINPFNALLSTPWAVGGWSFDTIAGLARFAREIERQAAMFGYINGFAMYTAMSGVGLLLVLTLRRSKAGM